MMKLCKTHVRKTARRVVFAAQNAEFQEFNMLSATLTFAQTYHCDITDNSVLLGSCESKQGQGGKLGHGGM